MWKSSGDACGQINGPIGRDPAQKRRVREITILGEQDLHLFFVFNNFRDFLFARRADRKFSADAISYSPAKKEGRADGFTILIGPALGLAVPAMRFELEQQLWNELARIA